MIGRSVTLACLLMAAAATNGAAQDNKSVTLHFTADQDAAAGVTNSAELIQFLAENVRLSASISMDSQLWVDMRGHVGDPAQESMLELLYLTDLRVALKPAQSVSNVTWSEAVLESHGDDFPDDGDIWDEQDVEGWSGDAAWAGLLEAVDRGLPRSSDSFGLLADGAHHELKISKVETRRFTYTGTDQNAMFEFSNCCYAEHGISGPAIVLRPELNFDAGRFPYNSDIDYDVDVLIVHLESTATPPPPPAAEDAEMARMLLSQGCRALAPSGAAEISIGAKKYEGGSTYRRGPNGEIMVVAGALDEGNPVWCLTIASAGPVDDQGSYEMVDPKTMIQERTSISAAFESYGEEDKLFWSTGGLTRFRIGDLAEGRLQFEGPLISGDGESETREMRGWFEAAPAD